MKTIKIYVDQSEAHMARGYLKAHDIEARVMGAREYTAHLLGGGAGRFELQVEPLDFLKANELLGQIPSQKNALTETASSCFRKAVFHAVLATLLLPVVFNMTSLQKTRQFWRASARSPVDLMKVILLILLQIPGLAALVYFVKAAVDFMGGDLSGILPK